MIIGCWDDFHESSLLNGGHNISDAESRFLPARFYSTEISIDRKSDDVVKQMSCEVHSTAWKISAFSCYDVRQTQIKLKGKQAEIFVLRGEDTDFITGCLCVWYNFHLSANQ